MPLFLPIYKPCTAYLQGNLEASYLHAEESKLHSIGRTPRIPGLTHHMKDVRQRKLKQVSNSIQEMDQRNPGHHLSPTHFQPARKETVDKLQESDPQRPGLFDMYKKKSLQKQKQKRETKQYINITRFIGLQDHITRFISASVCAHLLSSGKPQRS